MSGSDGGTKPQHVSFGVLILLLVAAGLYTLLHFLAALVWAGIFAVGLWPLYRRVTRRFGTGRSILWPTLFTLGVALVFLVPAALVGVQLAREAHQATDWVRDAQAHGVAVPDAVHSLPVFRAPVESWWQQNLASPEAARALMARTTHGRMEGTRQAAGHAGRSPHHPVRVHAADAVLPVREGHEVTQQLRRAAARAFGPGGERVGLQIIASIHGTVTGLVLVGLGEGASWARPICRPACRTRRYSVP